MFFSKVIAFPFQSCVADWWIAWQNVSLSDSWQNVAVIYIFRTILMLSKPQKCHVFFPFLFSMNKVKYMHLGKARASKLTNADLHNLQYRLAKRDDFVSEWNNFGLAASSFIADSCQIFAVVYIFRSVSVLSSTQTCTVFFPFPIYHDQI